MQAVLKQGIDEATQRLWAERVVLAVAHAFPSVEFSAWSLCERLLTQAHACAELIDQWRLKFPEGAQLLNAAWHLPVGTRPLRGSRAALPAVAGNLGKCPGPRAPRRGDSLGELRFPATKDEPVGRSRFAWEACAMPNAHGPRTFPLNLRL